MNQIQQFLSLFCLSTLWAKVLEETWILCPVGEDWMTSLCYFCPSISLPVHMFTTTDGCELFFFFLNEAGGKHILLHLELCIFETLKCKNILNIDAKDYYLSAHQGMQKKLII